MSTVKESITKAELESLSFLTTSFYAVMYPDDKATTYTMEMEESRTLRTHLHTLIGELDDFQLAEIEVEADNRGQHTARVMAEALHEMEWTRYLACIDD